MYDVRLMTLFAFNVLIDFVAMYVGQPEKYFIGPVGTQQAPVTHHKNYDIIMPLAITLRH